MSGLIALIFVFIWLIIIHVISRCIVKHYVREGRRIFWYFILIISLMFGTFADEIIDQYQIKEMCKPENLLIYDPEKIRGKTVVYQRVETQPLTVSVNSYISITQWTDAETGELLITDKSVITKGGWLSRSIGLQGLGPITYRGKCLADDFRKLPKKYNVKFKFK